MIETEALFKPFKLKKGVTLDNRFVLSPMVTNSSTKEGHITEDDLKRKTVSSLENYQPDAAYLYQNEALTI